MSVTVSKDDLQEMIFWLGELWGGKIEKSIRRGAPLLLKRRKIPQDGGNEPLFYWVIEACKEAGDRESAEEMRLMATQYISPSSPILHKREERAGLSNAKSAKPIRKSNKECRD